MVEVASGINGYGTGVFSSRKLERASCDSVAFRFITENDHPDHDRLIAMGRDSLPCRRRGTHDGRGKPIGCDAEGKKLYRLRKQMPEPVFGIIESVLGFRRFCCAEARQCAASGAL